MDDGGFQDVEDQFEPEPERKGVSIPWAGIFLVIWMAAVFTFAIQNAEDVTVEFISLDLTMPLAVLVLTTALFTALTTGLVVFFRRRRRDRGEAREG